MGLHQNQYFTFSGLTTTFTDFFLPVSHSQGRNCLPLNGLMLAYFQKMVINSISMYSLEHKTALQENKLNPNYAISEKSKAFLLYIILK